MKKKILLSTVVLASVLAGCGKYASQKQAMDACNEWEDKGERIDYSYGWRGEYEGYKRDRSCSLEEATSQFLGYQGELSRKQREVEGERIYWKDAPKPINLKVVRNFYY